MHLKSEIMTTSECLKKTRVPDIQGVYNLKYLFGQFRYKLEIMDLVSVAYLCKTIMEKIVLLCT